MNIELFYQTLAKLIGERAGVDIEIEVIRREKENEKTV